MKGKGLHEEQHRLLADHQSFIDVTKYLSEEQFKKQSGDKWSVADVVQHLYLSARPVVRLMGGSRDMLLQWGRPNTPSRTYNEIAMAYQNRLAVGAQAPASMSPRLEDMQVEKQIILDRFSAVYKQLFDAVGNWSEQELDEYVIPHPALGKLTVREMLHFTSVHTKHHLKLLPTTQKADD